MATIDDFDEAKMNKQKKPANKPKKANPPESKEAAEDDYKPVPIWEQSGGKDQYLVQGADLKCIFCPTPKKLKLPMTHGEYIGQDTSHPLANMMDCIPVVNIPSFNPTCMNPAYMPYPPPCVPAIIPPWQNPFIETTIQGPSSITVKSFLVCALGGIIKPQNSGQPKLVRGK